MKIKKMVKSFSYAISGIIKTVRTQRNVKTHVFVALCVLSACFLFDVSEIEFLTPVTTITLILGAETINITIEVTIDMPTNHYHPLAKIAKNTPTGAASVTAVNALLVGYIIFWDKISNSSYDAIHKVKESELYMMSITLALVVLATLIIKSIFGEGTPLRGRMPSEHSVLPFSIATTISLITGEPICMVLSYLMVLITVQSRVDSNVHSIWEVIVGTLFGTLLTLLIFAVFEI